MKDLTTAEQTELAADLMKFIEDRAFDGLECVVIVNGRGICKVAYSSELSDSVPVILAQAFRQVRDHNKKQAN